jgi:hypothetical protein
MRNAEHCINDPSIRTTIVLKTSVRLAAQQRALDERRSLSNFLARVVEDHVGADPPGFLRHEPSGAR